MTRLPYGALQKMTPEERRKHINAVTRRSRLKRRDKLNEQNRMYHELWKITKPFECTCIKCGNKFNACKYNRKVCPDCHTKAHNHHIELVEARAQRVATHNAHMAKILTLRKQGMTHKQIADKLGIRPTTVGNHLRSAGMTGKLNSAKP